MSKHKAKKTVSAHKKRTGEAFFSWRDLSVGKAITLTAVVAVFGVLFVTAASLMLDFSYRRTDVTDVPDAELGIDPSWNGDKNGKVINIALFGVDSRSTTSFSGRADSIMVVSIDKVHNKIKVISVMRDSLVPIEGYSPQKINAAYSLRNGGPVLAIKTLNQNFGLNIRDYATVNFAGMADIIDAVGGVEIEITEAERINANKSVKEAAKKSGKKYTPIERAGKQILNGAQAVGYARIRYINTTDGETADFGRTDRQRYVMEQLFNKALTISMTEYPALIKTMLKYMETSLTYSDILDMAGVLTGDISFEQTRVPLTEYVISASFSVNGGSSSVYYNLDYAKKIINAFIYDDMPPEEYIRIHGIDKTGWYNG